MFLEKKTNGQSTVTIAHVGDSRVVIRIAGKAQRITRDHKASDPDEQKRVMAEGGTIKNDRLGGSLAVTRSFGDFYYKKKGLSSVPEITTVQIGKDDEFIIMATDGIWDAMQD